MHTFNAATKKKGLHRQSLPSLSVYLYLLVYAYQQQQQWSILCTVYTVQYPSLTEWVPIRDGHGVGCSDFEKNMLQFCRASENFDSYPKMSQTNLYLTFL